MSYALRLVALAAMTVWMIGCQSVPPPQDVIEDAFPASGPMGFRMGGSFQTNVVSSDLDPSSSFDYLMDKSVDDLWKKGWGGFVEAPIDYSPYFGVFVGMGYERMPGESFGDRDVGALELLPVYFGFTLRAPFWLDREEWVKAEDPIWLPAPPNGTALYFSILGGGAWVLDGPRVDYASGAGRTRAFDVQAAPLLGCNLGLEYRFRDLGFWVEGGLRHYFIESGRDHFTIDGIGGPRVSVGFTWYGF